SLTGVSGNGPRGLGRLPDGRREDGAPGPGGNGWGRPSIRKPSTQVASSSTPPSVSRYSPADGVEVALMKCVEGDPTRPVACESGRSPSSAISSVTTPTTPIASSAGRLPERKNPIPSTAASSANGI